MLAVGFTVFSNPSVHFFLIFTAYTVEFQIFSNPTVPKTSCHRKCTVGFPTFLIPTVPEAHRHRKCTVEFPIFSNTTVPEAHRHRKITVGFPVFLIPTVHRKPGSSNAGLPYAVASMRQSHYGYSLLQVGICPPDSVLRASVVMSKLSSYRKSRKSEHVVR